MSRLGTPVSAILTNVRAASGAQYFSVQAGDTEECDTETVRACDAKADIGTERMEVWSLSVSSISDYFGAVSEGRGIRVWRQTSEQAFISDETEYRQEKQMLEGAAVEYTEIDTARAN